MGERQSQAIGRHANKPSPAWRERVPSASEAGERVGSPAAVAGGLSGALTLTRLVPLAALSRQAGEGVAGASVPTRQHIGPTWMVGTSPAMTADIYFQWAELRVAAVGRRAADAVRSLYPQNETR